jgi:hypothetical protein
MHYDVQGLEVLDEHFEPRFEVTLAKAGDSGESGYFTGTPGPRGPRAGSNRTSIYRPRLRSGPTYVVQCGTCSKRFNRTTRSLRMNTHKNPWGSPCPGRRGYLMSVR